MSEAALHPPKILWSCFQAQEEESVYYWTCNRNISFMFYSALITINAL